ncbi:hypothetical protein B0T25DRAFT_180417 [Lasiosphaeria hispida]|uniref:Nephrocystin 3-like N-terminal domain-containing protein n=1 Tax=Lasiosphaeria hispida TaxID=260671 RepID=A0AAJ0HGJ1_9PEZI|nr:hypothetical protein B0T25DRAFT_180417 [Lasiosphaeria hispida]
MAHHLAVVAPKDVGRALVTKFSFSAVRSNRQSTRDLLQCLIYQVLCLRPRTFGRVVGRDAGHVTNSLQVYLGAILAPHTDEPVVVVIDAVDEADSPASSLRVLWELQRLCRLKIIVTSRYGVELDNQARVYGATVTDLDLDRHPPSENTRRRARRDAEPDSGSSSWHGAGDGPFYQHHGNNTRPSSTGAFHKYADGPMSPGDAYNDNPESDTPTLPNQTSADAFDTASENGSGTPSIDQDSSTLLPWRLNRTGLICSKSLSIGFWNWRGSRAP